MTTTFNSYTTAIAAVSTQTDAATHARYKSLANGQSFADLDDYVSTRLPAVVLGDADADNDGQGYLTLDQLATVMAWKLMRGKYRATLMGLIRSNSPTTVIDVTTRAVQKIRARQQAQFKSRSKDEVASLLAVVKELTALRGVGPATATAIASFLDPDAPFMSDELLAAAGIKAPKYSLAEYERVVTYLDAICAGERSHPATSVDGAGAGGDVVTMSRREMERAIWAHAVLKKQQSTEEATSSAARPEKKAAKRTRASTTSVADDAPAVEDHVDDIQELPARRAPQRRRAAAMRSASRTSPPSPPPAEGAMHVETIATGEGTMRRLRPRRGAPRSPGA
ncbi:hypothetical protein GGF31_007807 [Allomyces arbusculus]|nr:hypothetical protein GGF31_007807 [Allomyces arbusculus]